MTALLADRINSTRHRTLIDESEFDVHIARYRFEPLRLPTELEESQRIDIKRSYIIRHRRFISCYSKTVSELKYYHC